MNTIIIPDKIETLKKKLKGTGWESIIYPYLDSENFYSTLKKLVGFVQDGKRLKDHSYHRHYLVIPSREHKYLPIV